MRTFNLSRVLVFLGGLLFLALQSCQKDQIDNGSLITDGLNPVSMVSEDKSYISYYGPKTFTITTKEAVNITCNLENSDFENLENFIIKVQNGYSGNTRVNKLEILINGVVIVNHTDFRGNKYFVTKPLPELTSNSVLEVRLAGSKGRFVKITIEGMLKPQSITDIDGNQYRIVKVCGKWWMAENLRTTRFNDGTEIKNVTNTTEWEGLGKYHTPAYCWYNDDLTNKSVYGALYSEGAVNGVNGKNVCPDGWHVAGVEWFTMIKCLDPESNDWGVLSDIAGKLVNEAGNEHWSCLDNPSTNETGLTILPGGHRYVNEPPFKGIGNIGFFWTGANGQIRFFCEGFVSFSEGWDDFGLSVRCVKDE